MAKGYKLDQRSLDKLEKLLRTSDTLSRGSTTPVRAKTREITSSGAWVKLDGSAAGRGFYTGHLVRRPSGAIDPSADLASTVIEASGASGADVYIINPGEISGSAGSHWLSPGGTPYVFFCVPWGVSDDASGNLPVYLIVDNQSTFCGDT